MSFPSLLFIMRGGRATSFNVLGLRAYAMSSQVETSYTKIATFGCPAYVLRNELQGNQPLPKWESRSRLGVYIGASPKHARSVGLILNLQTGLVSPQYNVRYDDFFETLDQQAKVKSEWQEKCHFTKQPASKKHWFTEIGKIVDQAKAEWNKGSRESDPQVDP